MSNSPKVEEKPARKYSKSSLTPAKKNFSRVYAITDNASEAVRQAYPEYAATASQGAISVKGFDLLRNPNVEEEVKIQKESIQKLANHSLQVFKDHLEAGSKPEIRQRAAEFVWEQNHGKATQHIESRAVSVDIAIDLSNS